MQSFRQYIEATLQLVFQKDHLNHHHGQDDYVIYACLPDTMIVVGKLEYSVYEDVPHIRMIQTADDYMRQGVATRLMQELQKEFAYNKINWGWQTKPGELFKSGLERKMGTSPIGKEPDL